MRRQTKRSVHARRIDARPSGVKTRAQESATRDRGNEAAEPRSSWRGPWRRCWCLQPVPRSPRISPPGRRRPSCSARIAPNATASLAGLAKNRDLRALSGFLREHYTTKADSANSLAAYVSGFTGSAPPPESRRGAAAARRAGEPEDARTANATPAAKPADEQSARRRRPPGVSSDVAKMARRDARAGESRSRSAAGTRETAALPLSEKAARFTVFASRARTRARPIRR